MTTDRPILFSAPMVRALLDGTKTQTRRVMKPQPTHFNPAGMPRRARPDRNSDVIRCPYGAPGDRLWVRETCRAEELPITGSDGVRYLADDHWQAIANTEEAAGQWVNLNWYRGKRGATVPPIHMPRWASRITLELSGVRVERLQGISDTDAISEGIGLTTSAAGLAMTTPPGMTMPRAMYRDLWEQINGPGSWDANPWVWVLDFKRAKGGAA